jgi:hypothetical protein
MAVRPLALVSFGDVIQISVAFPKVAKASKTTVAVTSIHTV